MTPDASRDVGRWVVGAVSALGLHAGLIAALQSWTDAPTAEPSAAVVINLAPMEIAPPAETPVDMPPGPEQTETPPPPDEPTEAKTEPEPEPDPVQTTASVPVVPPAVQPAVVLSPSPPKPHAVVHEHPEPPRRHEAKPKPEKAAPKPETRPRVTATTAPAPSRVRTAALAAAPAQGRPSPVSASSLPNWRNQLVALLERNKHYPPEAQARREQGTAELFFSINRAGHVLASRIVRSSGSAALDQESLAVVRRAQPFPPPPPDVAGAQISLTVPMRFVLR